MNCKQAKHTVALLAGEELQDDDSLWEHMAVCSGCCDYRRRLNSSLHALRSSGGAAENEGRESDSLWPELSARLRRVRLQTIPAARFNGWVPATATVAACLLIGLYLFQQPHQPQRHYLDGSPMVEQPLRFNQLPWPSPLLPERVPQPHLTGWHFAPNSEPLPRSNNLHPEPGRSMQSLEEVMTVPFWRPSLD